ncbi:MAG: ribosome biogenesis GTP-binding protein YihA/YsxC [Synergistetes bacterium]|nr:ribosome biogenesis GTP-binding protein YihA/YsxC [Synergistota bacterium]MDW8192734.1 ribosome biogenesis GTP-binding protein YihA/YsxC [Synergistota bacterium]
MVSAYLPEDIPSDFGLPEVAIAGRSNVGKSSFINVLLGQRLAKVSSTPGKTRSINFYLIDNRFILVDLPGYGYAKVPLEERKRWAKLVEAYVRGREALKLFLQIIDIRHIPMDSDLRLYEWIGSLGYKVAFIFTKVDKLSKSEVMEQLKFAKRFFPVEEENYVLFSALTGEGKKEAWILINRLLFGKGGE